MISVLRREIGSYYKGIMGYLFAAFLLIFCGIYTMAYNLSGYYANFEYALSSIAFIYLIGVPILTMRSVAEEKKQKTDQLLYSLPLKLSDVVIGKYLAMVFVLLVPCGVMALYPLLLSRFGNVAFSSAYGTLAAFFLLGACLISIGLFISSITENSVGAAVITLVVMLLLYFMSGLAQFVSDSASASLVAFEIVMVILAVLFFFLTKNKLISVIIGVLGCGGLYLAYTLNSSLFSGAFVSVMNALSVFDRFDTFVDGIFDLTAVVYYISIIGVFLFLTVQTLEKRRWSE